MRKRYIKIYAAMLIAALLLTVPVRAEDALLQNGELAGEDVPEGWTVVSYNSDGWSVSLEDGAVVLASSGANDLRLCQTVCVEENTAYVFAAEISASNVMGGRGASLSIDNYGIDGCYIYGKNILGSVDWTAVQLIFRTGEGQTEIRPALRLGGYSEMSSGTVRFRNVSLKKTSDGSAAVPLTGGNGGSYASGPEEMTEARRIQLRSFLHLFIVLAAAAAVALIFGVYRNRERIGQREITEDRRRKYFLLAVLAGLMLRSLLSSAWGGHDTDMGCWMGWGSYIARSGTASFYTAPGHDWYDYPPAYMLVLGVLTKLLDALAVPAFSHARVFAYMLPAYIADICTALLLMRCARKRGFSGSWQLLLGCLALFDPAVVMLSGAWGQIDSILTLFLLLSFCELLEGRRAAAGALYGLAVMVKWQALIFGPVLCCAYLLRIRSRRDLLETAAAVAAALGVILVLSLPFKGEQGLFWFVGRFLNAAGGYDYASVEAYNFQALCGGNWKSAAAPLLPGISCRAFGTASIILAVALAMLLQFRAAGPWLGRRKPHAEDGWALWLSASLCMYMIFTFAQFMHERYVFPVIFLLMMAFVFTREPKWLLCSMLLSVTTFLNEMTAMYVISEAASSVVRGGTEHNTVVAVCSFLEVVSFGYFAFLCGRIPFHTAGKGGQADA